MSYICLLTCGCKVEFQQINFRNCMEERCPRHGLCSVMDYRTDEWHTSCDSCSAGRKHGKARVYAERFAAQHMSRRPNHHMSVRYYNDWKAKPEQEPIQRLATLFDTLDDDPPF